MPQVRANADTAGATNKEFAHDWIFVGIVVLAILPLFTPSGSVPIGMYLIYFVVLGIAAALIGAYSVIGAFRHLITSPRK
jgi:hypothetical protein